MATQDQLNNIVKQNKYTRVTDWHNAGYRGEGINILVIDGESDHGTGNYDRVKCSAPNANIYRVSMFGFTENNDYKTDVEYEGKHYELEEIIKMLKIKLITKSLGGGIGENTTESKYYNNLKKKYNLIINHSAGNKKIGGSIPHDVAIWWTQVTLNKYDKPVKTNNFADGEQIDFATFPGFLNGTSFCSPYGTGMEALIIQRYGNDITQEQMYEYLKAHCVDLYDEGKDVKTGYGIPVLGEVEEEWFKMKKKIVIPIGSNTMTVDGKQLPLEQPAVIDKNTNRTLVPLRAIAEAFGAEVSWDNSTRTVIIEM